MLPSQVGYYFEHSQPSVADALIVIFFVVNSSLSSPKGAKIIDLRVPTTRGRKTREGGGRPHLIAALVVSSFTTNSFQEGEPLLLYCLDFTIFTLSCGGLLRKISRKLITFPRISIHLECTFNINRVRNSSASRSMLRLPR